MLGRLKSYFFCFLLLISAASGDVATPVALLLDRIDVSA
jgi:hypothetical protein